MPTVNQLVRKGRKTTKAKTKRHARRQTVAKATRPATAAEHARGTAAAALARIQNVRENVELGRPVVAELRRTIQANFPDIAGVRQKVIKQT